MAVEITIPQPVAPTKTVYLAAGGDMGTRPTNGGYPHYTGQVLDAFLNRYAAFPAWIAPLGDEVYQSGHLQHFFSDRFGVAWVYGGSSGGLTLTDKRQGDVHKHFLPVIGNHEGYDDLKGPEEPNPSTWTAANPYEPEYYGYDQFWSNQTINHPRTGTPYTGMGFTKAELNIPNPGVTRFRYYAKDLVANDGKAYWKFLALNSDKDASRSNNAAQFTWLEQQIADARDDSPSHPTHPGIVQHIVAGFHHPPIVSIAAGSNGEGAVRDFWLTLQEFTEGLTFILAGHVHLYQRFHPVRLTASGALKNPATSQPASVTDGVIEIVAGATGDNNVGQARTTYDPATGDGAHSDHLAAYGPTADYYGVSVMQLEPHRAIHEFVPIDHATRGNYRDPPVIYVDPRRPIPTDEGEPPPPPPAAPIISTITPSGQPPGATVTIDGSNMTGATQVAFGSFLQTTLTVVSASRITCAIPGNTTPGLRAVTVTNASGTSAPVNYTVGSPSGVLNAVASASFPSASYQITSVTRKRARMQGPRGGPYTLSVRIDAGASTYDSGTTFEIDWQDKTTTAAQANPVVTHTYTFRHSLTNWGWGLGRKDIRVTLRSPAGQVSSVDVPIFIMPDHPLWGIWQDNDTLSFTTQQTNVGRAIDSDKNTIPIISGVTGNQMDLPQGDLRNLPSNTYDVGAPHVIPYLDSHWASQKPDGTYASANWTWLHVIKNRKPAQLNFGGRVWPASTETPKEYVQRQCRQMYEWGLPFIWSYHQEPENDVDANRLAWNAAYPAESVSVVNAATFCQFWDQIDEWVRTTVQNDGTIGTPNMIASYMGPQGATWRSGANGGPDAWLAMTRAPDMIGASTYNHFGSGSAPWRDWDVAFVDDILEKARARGVPIFLGEVGCGPDPDQPNRKATWFLDMIDSLAGRTSLPNGLSFNNTDLMGLCWNSGSPGSFTDYRWFGTGVPSVVSQAVRTVFADDYTDWGFLGAAPPPPEEEDAPVISSFTPLTAQAGATVQISGMFFTGTTAVSFNGKPASTFAVISDTLIQATVPAGAINGPILVTNTGGTAGSSANFTYIPPAEVRGPLRLRAT